MDVKKIVIAGLCLTTVILSACSSEQWTEQTKNKTENQRCSLEVQLKEQQISESVPDSEDETQLEQTIKMQTPAQYQIENFPIINQMPELPTGCEITALTMAVNYYGYDIDKVTMATEYLPTVSANLHYGSDGLLYGSDLNEYFVGDPTTELGYICGTGAIVTAADSYLTETGSELRAEDITGTEPEQLYQFVSENIPVVVWVTIEMADRQAAQGWYTEQGKYVDWSMNDHGAVLIGYSEDTVIIADPISGLMEYDKQQFENVYESRGRQSVILN